MTDSYLFIYLFISGDTSLPVTYCVTVLKFSCWIFLFNLTLELLFEALKKKRKKETAPLTA